MIQFNKEVLDKLKKYENHFHTVLDLQYIRATTRDMDAIRDIYVNAGGKVVGYSSSCYQCRYNLVRQVGLAYRASVKNVSDKTKVKTDETKITKTKNEKVKGNSRGNRKSRTVEA